MGYVHTYGLTKEIEEIPAEALTKIQEVVEKYKDILRFECDEDKEPLVTKTYLIPKLLHHILVYMITIIPTLSS